MATVSSPPIGLLAGGGRFPILFAEKARSLGLSVACVGIRDNASSELIPLVDYFDWYSIGRLGGIIRFFRRRGACQIVMAGKIEKTIIFSRSLFFQYWPDWRTIRTWVRSNRKDNRDDSILLAIIAEFEKDGMTFASALELCPELLVSKKQLTRRAPTAAEEKDIAFGWELAKEMGRLDIGQSVAVKDRAVLAVEAIEGTDQAILRAGGLCRKGGFVVVKVAKPQQDMRFDVPTVGCSTIENLHQAGGRVLAIEGGKTIVIDQEKVVALANRYAVSIVAL